MGLGLPFIVSREFSAEDIVSCDTIMVAAGNVSSLENDKVCKSSCGHLTVSVNCKERRCGRDSFSGPYIIPLMPLQGLLPTFPTDRVGNRSLAGWVGGWGVGSGGVGGIEAGLTHLRHLGRQTTHCYAAPLSVFWLNTLPSLKLSSWLRFHL